MDKSELLFEEAQKVMPGGVNSPVRAFRAVNMAPPYFYGAGKRVFRCGLPQKGVRAHPI